MQTAVWHWLGTAIRLVPADFELRSRLGVGVDWPITDDELEPWYQAAENSLGVDEITHVDQIQGAGHIMGTDRMGDDPATSVTDPSGRTWDHPNLWLAGSDLFPTTGTANPTLTMAALALRAAPEVFKDLTKSSVLGANWALLNVHLHLGR